MIYLICKKEREVIPMTNVQVFNKIFWEVGDKHNLNTWYEIFDSEVFNEVVSEICKYFNATTPDQIVGFNDWYDEMYWEL
jgi:hypothetical protein